MQGQSTSKTVVAEFAKEEPVQVAEAEKPVIQEKTPEAAPIQKEVDEPKEKKEKKTPKAEKKVKEEVIAPLTVVTIAAPETPVFEITKEVGEKTAAPQIVTEMSVPKTMPEVKKIETPSFGVTQDVIVEQQQVKSVPEFKPEA